MKIEDLTPAQVEKLKADKAAAAKELPLTGFGTNSAFETRRTMPDEESRRMVHNTGERIERSSR